MQKLVGLNGSDALKVKLEKLHGGYNDFPPGWVEIGEKDVLNERTFFLYSPEVIEHRQMFAKDERGIGRGACLTARLYHFHDGTGIAMSEDYDKNVIRWFRFGCVHEWRSVTPQECSKRGIYHAPRCYSVSECKKCGHIKSIDSSD